MLRIAPSWSFALLLRDVDRLMHDLDKTVLTTSSQIEPRHAFLKYVGAVEKRCTVEQRAVSRIAMVAALCPRL
jgi:hypothetical protein